MKMCLSFKKMYITEFNLSCPVNDFNSARDYLLEDDMTQYLPEELKKKVKNIRWELKTVVKGNIVITTKSKLSSADWLKLEQWIIGQNSDGLGEGFSGQDFAVVWENDEIVDTATIEDTEYKFEEYK